MDNPFTKRPAFWAEPITLKGVPNLHRVSINLYRSAQPGLRPEPKPEDHEEFYFGDYGHEVPLAFVNFGSSWLENPNMPKACTKTYAA